MYDKQAIQTIRTSELNPNPWNTNVVSPDNQAKIEESVKRFGMFKPLVCRTLEDGTVEILGGQHRWEAAKALGIEEVQIVNLGQIDEKTAKEISLVDNGRYGSDDLGRLADLLQDLGTADDLSEYMPYTVTDLNQFFTTSTIDLDALSMDDDNEEVEEAVKELTSDVQKYRVMRFKVPLEDAELVQGVIDGVAQLQGFTGSDSLTNAGDALVYLCRARRDEG